jgi:hypothetical protein
MTIEVFWESVDSRIALEAVDDPATHILKPIS